MTKSCASRLIRLSEGASSMAKAVILLLVWQERIKILTLLMFESIEAHRKESLVSDVWNRFCCRLFETTKKLAQVMIPLIRMTSEMTMKRIRVRMEQNDKRSLFAKPVSSLCLVPFYHRCSWFGNKTRAFWGREKNNAWMSKKRYLFCQSGGRWNKIWMK